MDRERELKPNYYKKQCFSSSFLLEVNIKVQNGYGVHSRLVPCLKFIELTSVTKKL